MPINWWTFRGKHEFYCRSCWNFIQKIKLPLLPTVSSGYVKYFEVKWRWHLFLLPRAYSSLLPSGIDSHPTLEVSFGSLCVPVAFPTVNCNKSAWQGSPPTMSDSWSEYELIKKWAGRKLCTAVDENKDQRYWLGNWLKKKKHNICPGPLTISWWERAKTPLKKQKR